MQNMSETPRSFRSAFDPVALTALRIGAGVIIAAHGLQKATGLAEWQAVVAQLGLPAPDVMARLSVAAELGGGLLLVIGLLTPFAALAIAANMAVAIATVHLGHGLFAQSGGWEYPLVLLLIGSYFTTHGAGPLSVDAVLTRLTRARGPRWRGAPDHRAGVASASRI